VRLCVRVSVVEVCHLISYKPFDGISPNLRFRYIWRQRWTD